MMQKVLCLVFFLVSVRSIDWGITVAPGQDAIFTYQTQEAFYKHAGLDVFLAAEPFQNPHAQSCHVSSYVDINISDTKTTAGMGFDFVVPGGVFTERHLADPYFENCGNAKLEAGQQVPIRVVVSSNCSLTLNGTIYSNFQHTEIPVHTSRLVSVSPVTADYDTYLTLTQEKNEPLHLKLTGFNASVSDFFDSVIVAFADQCINTFRPDSPNRKTLTIPKSTSAEFVITLGTQKIYYVKLNKKMNVPRIESFNATLEVDTPMPAPTPNNVGIAIGITLPLLVVIFVVVYLCYRKNQTYSPV